MARKWFVPVAALVVVVGSATAVTSAALASPRLAPAAATGATARARRLARRRALAACKRSCGLGLGWCVASLIIVICSSLTVLP